MIFILAMKLYPKMAHLIHMMAAKTVHALIVTRHASHPRLMLILDFLMDLMEN